MTDNTTGTTTSSTAKHAPTSSITKIDTAIIGTGFSGIGMGVSLLKQGLTDFTIFEKADSLGGTWRDNNYPGCACDVQSHLYSFSFAPNPNWSRAFAPQPEIKRYLEDVSAEYGLKQHLKYGHELVAANYQTEEKCWHLRFRNGRIVEANKLISAIGALHIPNRPEIKGAETFAGDMFHSAEWQQDVDLTGKRVAVIGTGASAIQFVPAIVQKVKSITVFQRSPAWVIPKPDREIGSLEKKLYNSFSSLMSLQRGRTWLQLETRAIAFNYARNVLKLLEARAKRYIRSQVKDPAKAEALTPDYRIGCKRILISNDFYSAMNRNHVSIETDAISEITEKGIIDANGNLHEVDVIILGTGFKTLDAIKDLHVANGEGTTLAETWKNGAHCHLGTMVSGFPNFFLLLGPNTGLGHSSQVFMIESQINYVSDAIKKMKKMDVASVDVRPSVQAAFIDKIQASMKRTIWTTGCDSWYLDANGKNWTTWPGFTFAFRWMTRKFDLNQHICERDLTAIKETQAHSHIKESSAQPGELTTSPAA